MENWESGSFFHFDAKVFAGKPWLPATHQLYGSGRDALKALVAHGVSLGWKKLWVPSYYCHEVTEAVRSLIAVELYPCNFLSKSLSLHLAADEAAIVVEYFGQRSVVNVSGGVVVLDVTHDPAAGVVYERVPDYTFASLRKTCFLPDGGCLWSATGATLPCSPLPSAKHEQASIAMLKAMVMKAVFLAGGCADKTTFLDWYRSTEAVVGQGDGAAAISSFSNALVHAFDMTRVRGIRADNVAHLCRRLQTLPPGVVVVASDAYFILMLTSASQRNAVRQQLIDRCIYPIALWPLGELDVPKEDRDLSDRVLMIHCDARYGHDDMEVVAAAIEKALGCVDVC